MSSTTIETLVKMMESVPAGARDQVLERLREYLADVLDDIQWDATLEKTVEQLTQLADRARSDIEAGLSRPLDPDQL